MKKILLSILSVIALQFYAKAQCTDVIISKYIQFGGNNKAIEIYNTTNHDIDLKAGAYRVERYKSPSSGPISTSVSDTLHLKGIVHAYSTWVIVNGQKTDIPITGGTSPKCDPGLQLHANQFDTLYGTYGSSVGQPMYFKGNDCLQIRKDTALVDAFGETGQTVKYWSTLPPYRGATGQGKWLSKGFLLVRKASVKDGHRHLPDPAIGFNILAEYDTIPELDSLATYQDTLDVYAKFGSQLCDCNPSSIREVSNSSTVNLFPNPAENSKTVYALANWNIKSIEVFNVCGSSVYKCTKPQNILYEFPVDNLSKGAYFVKITGNGGTQATKKLIIN